MIINTDAKNEADDQYAIVHALLSTTVDVRHDPLFVAFVGPLTDMAGVGSLANVSPRCRATSPASNRDIDFAHRAPDRPALPGGSSASAAWNTTRRPRAVHTPSASSAG